MTCLDEAGTPAQTNDDQWLHYKIPNRPGFYSPVTVIVTDSNNGVWVGTENAGLHYINHGGTPFDPSDDTKFTSKKKNGLAGNYIYDIHIDANGGTWVATSDGLSYLP